MLQIINNLPEHVVGIYASGEVTRNDMETVLIPKIQELKNRQGEINYLLVLGTGVQNFTLAAWWDDLKLGLTNFTNWHRIAVVTDQKGVEWFTDIFQFMIPGKSRGFSPDQLEEAKAWVSGEEI
ncbi:STAS/SEC14 domain-containing protein [Mucilaginibacter sp. cycad4]|uniref:STAS/SEC14 domain-containing protein n=1 Tax=Mucilaginibacter sp. cycad4 TaxID=3342096 RepID=UPI002AABB389|nr:STAS/SEC14 domain-containing protein [Mucilaginibacter gossypii]WPV01431.1 STAS/SEC14 domain-containing protein [Mucilaginibacter gossypii]